MTALQAMYRELRDAGRGHHAALRELARQMGVDVGTVGRVLERGDRERHRPARRRGRRDA